MKSGFIDKLISRLDRVDPIEVQSLMMRLVKEKGFFERVFEALEEGVVICDSIGQVTFINRAACGFFGVDRAAVAGKKISESVRGMEWSALAGRSGGAFSRDLEIFYPEHRYLNVYFAPISEVEEKSQSLGFVLLIRDITQTRRMTEEMLESERMNALTMMAAGVAHEIGNPLNSLNIHLQLLERKLRKSSPDVYDGVKGQLEIARGEIQRLDFIIAQFLGAIRPSKPNFEMTDINKVLESAVDFLAQEIKDRGITARLQLNTDLPMLRADGNQLKQAFYNLIKNACQAMGKGGRLTIRTDLTEFEATITFVDNGPGMKAETLSAIGQPYFTTKKSGTGLGLLIVRRIVREHGGELTIHSEEKVGTTITIHLPRRPKAARFLASSEPEAKVTEPEIIDV